MLLSIRFRCLQRQAMEHLCGGRVEGDEERGLKVILLMVILLMVILLVVVLLVVILLVVVLLVVILLVKEGG